jgi:hypothetical protein
MDENQFRNRVNATPAILPGPTGGLAQKNPVGRSIAAALKAGSIDKSFHQI